MGYRNFGFAAVLATGLAGFTGIAESSWAETIAVDNGIAVKESDVATPARGMTMDQVAAKFGAPASKIPAVGQPPISRWDYPGFVVYFERNYVIHSVVANS
jgi:outer membrane protein assembly factor BamE (lipoprotein component of BamABCDE complex)